MSAHRLCRVLSLDRDAEQCSSGNNGQVDSCVPRAKDLDIENLCKDWQARDPADKRIAITSVLQFP